MNEWGVVRLRRICEINPRTPEFLSIPPDDPVTFLPLEAIWPHALDTSRASPKHQLESGYTRFREGDVLVPKITPTFQASRSVVARNLRGGVGYGTTELHVLRPRAGLDTRFLFYITHSDRFLQGGIASMQGVAGQKRVPESVIANHLVVLPSLEIQRKIADFLDRETARIDAVIQEKRLLLRRVAERRQSVIFHGVTGVLSPSVEYHDPGVPWARQIRKPWPATKIKHVARRGTGHTPSRSHPELWEDCTIPWVTTGEIQHVRDDRVEVLTDTRERISELGLANSAAVLHPAGTVVLCRTASAGFSARMGADMATSQDFATWTCSERLLPRYLLMCLRAMRPDLIGRLAFGSTHKTIYMPDIEELQIPLPTIEEQQDVLTQIDSRLARLDAPTRRLVRQLSLLSEHRQALITAAVSGRTWT